MLQAWGSGFYILTISLRRPSVFVPGLLIHVVSQDNQGQPIFRAPTDSAHSSQLSVHYQGFYGTGIALFPIHIGESPSSWARSIERGSNMGISKRLFREKDEAKTYGRHADQDSMIRMYDGEGNEYVILKSEYRQKVLSGQFRDASDNADKLYAAIVMALQDGFVEDCLLPAERLHDIDPNRERSATVLGIVLTKNGQLDAAQEVLEAYLREVALSGVVLTNLAKVFSQKGQDEDSYETLWKALTVDPNQDNGLEWWGAIHHERGGETAFVEAMEQAAGIEDSWRPQLWLARKHLEGGNLAAAMAVYQQVLPLASTHGDALMMISGDLGNNGYVRHAVELVRPVYQPERHGPMAGLNLIQACIDIRDREAGLKLCAAVERLQRYDLTSHLDQLRTELLQI